MGRWTQYDSDEYRLPEGFVRTAYDADTQQYTYRDTRSGGVYRGAPGSVYGILRPVVDRNYLPDRPNAFAPEGNHHSRRRARPAAPEMTFPSHGILPAYAITTAPPKDGSRSTIFQRPLSSSHFNNPLHSHSKSVSERTARDRDDYDPYQQPFNNSLHPHSKSVSERTAPRNRDDYDPYQHKRANTTGGSGTKSGFSLTSTFKRLSRSLTTTRRRPRQEKSTDDEASSYQHL